MSFRDNLLHLRASHNMTQEQLAMILGVSRQSVTKWESERSYPEMDKLLKLCQTFDCTLDDLVQGDLTNQQPNAACKVTTNTPPADVFGYDEHMRKFANKIAGGVLSVVLGCAISIVFFSAGDPSTASLFSLPENTAAAIGTICVLIGVAIGLILFIPAGMEHSQFVREHPYIEDFYTSEQKTSARTAFYWQLIGGIAIIFAGICIILLFSDSPYEDSIGTVSMVACVAIGAALIVRGSINLSRINLSNYNLAAGEILETHEINESNIPQEQKEELLAVKRTDKRIGAICGTIMMVATIVGLVMLFVPEYSTPFFWLAWPIGGLLCGISSVLIKGFSNN
ncbi:helix-turn-helix transcriptional regulator [Adlercreutzia sp. ZJ154]|uniref:helix-turn-helix transcriptional regulator n=1 Tax=Adlercreutzia sp. ZJ154 TaxID=2709790 RepID=UPI0013EAA870|nr:helix-turn-helix transcriptional regulator [Adlercreutzia sp. ZJ154]